MEQKIIVESDHGGYSAVFGPKMESKDVTRGCGCASCAEKTEKKITMCPYVSYYMFQVIVIFCVIKY